MKTITLTRSDLAGLLGAITMAQWAGRTVVRNSPIVSPSALEPVKAKLESFRRPDGRLPDRLTVTD